MNKKRLFVIILVSFISLNSCATLQHLVQEPTVDFDSMSLRNLSLFEGTVVFNFDISNPNPIGLTLNKLSYNLKIDENEFVKGILDKGINLKANGSTAMELPITINYLDFLGSVTQFMKKDNVAYDLSGVFEFFGFDIPYHNSGNIQIPDLPDISIENVGVKNISLTGASVVFTLGMDNQNSFPVNISGLDYGIKLGGIQFADGKSNAHANIGKNGKTTMEIPVNVNFLQMGLSAYNLLTKSSSEYTLAGNIKIDVPETGEKNFPFSKIGNVIFSK